MKACIPYKYKDNLVFKTTTQSSLNNNNINDPLLTNPLTFIIYTLFHYMSYALSYERQMVKMVSLSI